jgi:hypothetical protein
MKIALRAGTKSPSFSRLSQVDIFDPLGGKLCSFGTPDAAQLYVAESVR